jgi:hypothetical protein
MKRWDGECIGKQTTAAERCDTYAADHTIIPGPRTLQALQVMNWLSGSFGTMQANQISNLVAKTTST